MVPTSLVQEKEHDKSTIDFLCVLVCFSLCVCASVCVFPTHRFSAWRVFLLRWEWRTVCKIWVWATSARSPCSQSCWLTSAIRGTSCSPDFFDFVSFSCGKKQRMGQWVKRCPNIDCWGCMISSWGDLVQERFRGLVLVGTCWNHSMRDQLYPKPKLLALSTAFLGRPTDGKLVPKVTGLPISILLIYLILFYLLILAHTVFVLPPSFTPFQDVARRDDFVVLISDHLRSSQIISDHLRSSQIISDPDPEMQSEML